MKIYIASSWKNQSAVEMLTILLRKKGYGVESFIENPFGEHEDMDNEDFKKWIWSGQGEKAFDFDTKGASNSDLVIYIGPSGTDAWAEVGVAWARGVRVFGLWGKGEPAGLMRRMVAWFKSVDELLKAVDQRADNQRKVKE